ncbi:MAG: hypothetical protein MUC84_01260 [Solirubrobacteraceae bacterium]|jgi:hypothetical protein|nr:hypothetical protein [Solirubrobacteraceae bacterium]
MTIATPPAPMNLTFPAATPVLHSRRRGGRGLAAGRVGRHVAAELQRGRALHDILDDREVTSQLELDGRAVAMEPEVFA